MIEISDKYEWNCILVKKVEDNKVGSMGMIDLDLEIVTTDKFKKLYSVTDIIEKPNLGDNPTNLAIIGRYVIRPDLLFYILKHTRPGAQGEIQLSDALCEMVKLHNNDDFWAYESLDTNFIDIGDPFGALKASIMELDNNQKQELSNFFLRL